MKMENEINFISPYSTGNRIKRMVWTICWNVFARPFPKSSANAWKVFLLKCFGAKIAKNAYVYSSARIFMPWNLIMEEQTCIGSEVKCYNAAPVILKKYATVSERAYLCTASHNISSPCHEQIANAIIIGQRAWIAAEAFIGPGVAIGEGAVVGARGCVFKDIEPWTVVGGNPAKFLKKRIINNGNF